MNYGNISDHQNARAVQLIGDSICIDTTSGNVGRVYTAHVTVTEYIIHIVMVQACGMSIIKLDQLNKISRIVMEALILSTVLLVVDWGQTREIAVNPRYREINVVLGENPSLDKVDLYFTTVIIGNAIISNSIKSKKYRNIYDYGVAFSELSFVVSNHSVDVKMNWQF
ncbi:MAG: hypothetical protein JRJ62_00155 [Deltaproteobacteria bacterium]|nr:hypothetical protein [Deltaproteobacteria bacterium]